MARKTERTNVFKVIFSTLIVYDCNLVYDNSFFKKNRLNSEFESSVLDNFFLNFKKYIEYLSGFLKINWSWKRLSYVDRSVLLLAISEWNVLKTEKAVIINECLNLVKKFGEIESTNYINAVLDKALK